MNQKVSEAQGNYKKKEPQRREGEVTINYSSANKKHKDNEGEYVDFEEIKE